VARITRPPERFPGAIVLASLPYALLCTTVLMGKHIDKIPWDAPTEPHTLPVLLGEARARKLTQAMFVGFYVSVIALVIARVLPVASVLVLLSLPVLHRTWTYYSQPKPAESPMPESGVAAVVRGAVVPRDPPRGRAARARIDRRRDRRLVRTRAASLLAAT
jgi:1,4-dihydroxy-2-naphthoate octaprenyltransferase